MTTETQANEPTSETRLKAAAAPDGQTSDGAALTDNPMFSIIGANMQTAQKCCETMEAEITSCNGKDLSGPWEHLKRCLASSLSACEEGAKQMNVTFDPGSVHLVA